MKAPVAFGWVAWVALAAACSDDLKSNADPHTVVIGPDASAAGGLATNAGGSATGGSTGGATPAASGGKSESAGTTGGTATTGGSSAAGSNSPPAAGGTTGSGGAAPSGGKADSGGAGSSGKSGGNAGAPPAGADVIATITNGGYWDDVDGKRIEAHGGGFLNVDGTWYWVGEDKSHNSGNFKAVNLYSSPDLQHWTLRNAIITRDTAPELAAADRIIERPKLTYNETTKRFVMWLHWEGANYAEAEAGVFSCATIDGDYEYENSFRPNDNMSRDDTLFKDDDGKAYFISAANENADLVVYELTDDYLDIERQLTVLWPGSKREAPAMFKVGERYFLITSGATGWDPNQAKYSTATAIAGPWSALANLGDATTFDTQSTFVIPVVGSEATTYVYAGDRWQDPDLVSSKYIWLPLAVSGQSLSLAYYPEWSLNVTRGTWSIDDGYVPQSGWKVVSVSSQETVDEDGAAANAFDDSASTKWHTEYGDAGTPAHPHELVIDLGASYALTAFRYTPRQDKDENGMIAGYEFYVSDSSTSFGEPVAKGTFGTSREATKVTFPEKNGRYIRLVALSEINGQKFTSVAELDVEGTPR